MPKATPTGNRDSFSNPACVQSVNNTSRQDNNNLSLRLRCFFVCLLLDSEPESDEEISASTIWRSECGLCVQSET